MSIKSGTNLGVIGLQFSLYENVCSLFRTRYTPVYDMVSSRRSRGCTIQSTFHQCRSLAEQITGNIALPT